MGLIRKIGDALNKIDYHISDDPEIVGKRFEDHVESLLTPKYFTLVEKTHSFKTNEQRYVESSLNPDLIFRFNPTSEKFAVECKYRTHLNKDRMLEWSNPSQLQRYREFAKIAKMPVYVVIGLRLEKRRGKESYYEKHMFNIPLDEAKYPALYPSVFGKFEREYKKPFFWDKGKLY
jgi:hypothetical protein